MTAPLRAPGRPRDERAEASIIDATIDLLAEAGYAGVSMDAVAARAGVSKATVYRRWASKEALLLDASACLAPPDGSLPDTGTIRDDLLALYAGFGRALREGPVGQLLPHLVAEAARNPDFGQLLAEFNTARKERWRQVLARAVDRGELRADLDLQVVVDALIGPFVVRHLVTGAAIDAEFAESLVDLLLPGLRA